MRDFQRNKQANENGHYLIPVVVSLLLFGIICIGVALIGADFAHLIKVKDVSRLYWNPGVEQHQHSGFFQETLVNIAKMDVDAKSAILTVESGNKNTCSGFFVSPDGYLLINGNLADNDMLIDVITNDERRFTAKLIGTDPENDITLLKIDSNEKFPYFELDKNKKAQIGDWIIAIGEPVSFIMSVRDKIQSAQNRNDFSIGKIDKKKNTDSDEWKMNDSLPDEKPQSQTDSKNEDVNVKNIKLNTEYSFKNETGILKESNQNVEISRTAKPVKPIEQSADISKIEHSYKNAILKKVDENKMYPPVAQRLGHDGRVLVSFAVKMDGTISDLSIIEGSKYPELNTAALDSLRHASPFDPIPVELNSSSLIISLWITFELKT